VKKGSNRRRRVSASMPQPLSSTSIRASFAASSASRRTAIQPPAAGSAVTPGLLQNRAAFLAKIDEAVGVQKKHLAGSEEALAIERTRLLLASRDRLVLDKLAASYQSAERRLQEQREQRVLDDLGARQHHERREEKP